VVRHGIHCFFLAFDPLSFLGSTVFAVMEKKAFFAFLFEVSAVFE
jgi:hypothetical protein